ncbi:hypothetical protein [Nocardioides massiliensis]|nr:hypothetical protein [Nocardioides massiliensis]
MLAAVVVLVVAIAAFAVDLGVQRVERRDMQALADVVAMDMARELKGRSIGEIREDEAWTSALRSTVERQLPTENGSWSVDTGEPGASVATSVHYPEIRVKVTFAMQDDAGLVDVSGDDDLPEAVKVQTSSSVDFAFVGGAGGVSRQSYALAQATACFRVGSLAASVDSAQSALLNPILGALLGSTVDLDLVHYQGLANASVTLTELVEIGGLSAGSPERLLHSGSVEIADLIDATITVLDARGLVDAQALKRLGEINVAASTPPIRLGDLIKAAPGDDAALDADVNVLDLISGAAFLSSRGRSAIGLNDFSLALPDSLTGATVSADLDVIQAPQMACGHLGTVARTAQVVVRVNVQIPARTISVPGLATSVTVKPATITLTVDLAGAEARLLDVPCTQGDPTSMQVAVKSAVAGPVSVAGTLGFNVSSNPLGGLLDLLLGWLKLSLLDLLSAPTIVVEGNVGVGASIPMPDAYNRSVSIPLPTGYGVRHGTGSGVLLSTPTIEATSATNVSIHYKRLFGSDRVVEVLNTEPLFDNIVSPVVSGLTSVLGPLVDDVLQPLIVEPLSKLLGLQLGGADIVAVPDARCASPRLIR